MSTKYPNQIDTNTEIPLSTDNVTPIRAVVTNTLRNAILSVESELGIQPSGTFSTVRARLDALEALLSTLNGDVVSIIPPLENVLNQGNTTEGINILLNNNSDLVLSSGSSIRSTTDTVEIDDNLSVNNNKIKDVATPTTGTDAANKNYVDSITASGSAGGDLSGTYPNPTVRDLTITSETQGSVIYFNGSNWVALAPGPDGYFLQLDSTTPKWGLDGDIVVDSNVSYTPLLANANKYHILTHASPTFTVPTNASVAYKNGTILIIMGTTGQITLSTSGITIVKPSDTNSKSRIAGSTITLKKVSTNTWHLGGDLEPSP